MTKFIIDRQKNGTFQYSLVETTGELMLTGQGYGSKQGCKIGINSVQNNAPADEQYDRKKGRNGKAFFNLLSHNGRVIGVSSTFNDEESMEKTIKILKKKARAAKIVDVTKTK